ERQAEGAYLLAHHIQGGLDGNGIDLHEEAVGQSQILHRCGQSLLPAALQVVHDHVVDLPGHDIGPHGDDAAAADGEEGDGDVVVAAPEGKVGADAVGDLHGVGHITAGFLDAADIGVLGKALHILHGDGAAGTARDVIEDAGDIHRVGHGYKV